nr:uncharacterized protein LOC123751278 [Procambarus clarkii]
MMMMRVVTCVVVVTAAVLVLVDAAPQTGAPLGQSRPETSSQVMITLAQELCEQQGKGRCVARVAECLKDQSPVKPSDCSVWKQQMLANITTCARQLDYSFTPPPSPEDISLSSESGESEENSEETYEYYEELETFLKKTNFLQDQLVPMVRCLLTENQMLEKFSWCVNQ